MIYDKAYIMTNRLSLSPFGRNKLQKYIIYCSIYTLKVAFDTRSQHFSVLDLIDIDESSFMGLVMWYKFLSH